MAAVVAAGNPHTAHAAAEILRAGGNAVDAIVAGGLAAFIAEPLLASAGGAGMLTVAMPEGEAVVDFFSATPGLGGLNEDREFISVDINFGAARQRFHVGRGSAAPPVAFPGLAEAAKRFGSLPLSAIVEPAMALAREGAPVSPESAEVFGLLWPINQLSADTMAAYSPNDEPPTAGARHPMPGMIDVLRAFAEHGDTPPHVRAAMLEAFGIAAGGCLTPEDLDAARPAIVEPRRFEVGGWQVSTSPRIGGHMIEVITGALKGDPASRPAVEARRIALACKAGHLARQAIFDSEIGVTTHLSVIDAKGGAASMTLTNGEGCGHLIPGTPIQLNNFMGEEDLHPQGFFGMPPGTPLPSMIAPCVARSPEGVLALGSGGANRIRSVVSQVLHRVTRGESLQGAVLAPRIHAEHDAVWLEMAERAEPAETLHQLHDAFGHVYEFPIRAFFFGGVHAVMQRGKSLEGMGDPRRGGAVVEVP